MGTSCEHGQEAGGGCGARVHPVPVAAGGDVGGLAEPWPLTEGMAGGASGSASTSPAWSLPITISSTESPFKTRHKSPGSKVVTLGTASPRNPYHSWGGSDAGWDGGTVVQGVPAPRQGSSASSAVPWSALVSRADFINSRSVFPGHMLSCIQNTFVRTSIFNAIYAKCCCKKQPLT